MNPSSPPCSFVLGAVSPAVVVPSMLLLQKDGYGVEQGIPTLLMAAGSFDDILAITGFTTCLGMAFATGKLIDVVSRAEGKSDVLNSVCFSLKCNADVSPGQCI